MISNSDKKTKEVALSTLGLIRTGHHFRERVEPSDSGNVRVVQAKDFTNNGKIDAASLTPVDLDGYKKELVLQDGDIILRSRGGSNFPAAVIENLPFIAMPSFPILLIRIQTKNVLPDYLAWHLNQLKTQNKLQSEAMGTFVPTVSKTTLAGLLIPIPSMKVQKDIVTLNQLVEEECRILQEISLKRQAVTNGLLLQYAQEGMLPEKAACLLKDPDSAVTPSGSRLLEQQPLKE